jgi:hypothetical protein
MKVLFFTIWLSTGSPCFIYVTNFQLAYTYSCNFLHCRVEKFGQLIENQIRPDLDELIDLAMGEARTGTKSQLERWQYLCIAAICLEEKLKQINDSDGR